MYKKVLQLPTVTVSNQSFCIIIHQQGQWQHHFPHSNLLRNTVIIKEYAGGPQPHQRPLRKKTWHKYTSQNIEHATQRIGEFYLRQPDVDLFFTAFFSESQTHWMFQVAELPRPFPISHDEPFQVSSFSTLPSNQRLPILTPWKSILFCQEAQGTAVSDGAQFWDGLTSTSFQLIYPSIIHHPWSIIPLTAGAESEAITPQLLYGG